MVQVKTFPLTSQILGLSPPSHAVRPTLSRPKYSLATTSSHRFNRVILFAGGRCRDRGGRTSGIQGGAKKSAQRSDLSITDDGPQVFELVDKDKGGSLTTSEVGLMLLMIFITPLLICSWPTFGPPGTPEPMFDPLLTHPLTAT